MLHRHLISSGALFGVAHLFEAALPFIRNVAVAYLMAPREFALSFAISTVAALAEMMTDMGLAQMAVRYELENARARATLHALAAIRGLLVCALVLIAAFPIAALFGASEAGYAFMLAGLCVGMRGFSNLSVKQLTRSFRYGPEAISIIISQLAWTGSVIAGGLAWHDHRAMAWGVLVYAAIYVLCTHRLSPARYGLAWDRAVVSEATHFARPLIPNGFALAINSLMDRIVIGATRGLDALALYAPLSTTAMLPRITAIRYVYGLFLPAMVNRIQAGEDVRPVARGWIAIVSLIGVVFGLGFMSLAEPVIRLVFGAAYAPAPELTILMGLLLTCRVLLTYPVPMAMATGKTWFVTGSSAITALALAPGAASLILMGSDAVTALAWFLGTMVGVETLGIVVLAARMRKAFPGNDGGVLRFGGLAMGLVIATSLAFHLFGLTNWMVRALLAVVPSLVAFTVFGFAILAFLRDAKLRRKPGSV